MIDELAKAICCSQGCRSKELGACVSDMSEEQARAVLRRLRQPTDAMKVAGGLAFEDAAFGEQMLVFDAAGLSFTAMIDAALGEKA